MTNTIYFMLFAAQGLLAYRFAKIDPGIKAKMMASAIFVTTGLYLLIYEEKWSSVHSCLLVAGLLASFLGDWLLKYTLFKMPGLPGIVFFALAHILYITAFISLCPPDLSALWLLIPWFAIVLTAFLVQKKIKINFNGSGPAVTVYLFIISAMVCLGCRAGYMYIDFTDIATVIKGIILIAGVVLFMISDCGVCLYMFGEKRNLPFGKKNYSLNTFNLVTYYAGQFLIATSVLM